MSVTRLYYVGEKHVDDVRAEIERTLIEGVAQPEAGDAVCVEGEGEVLKSLLQALNFGESWSKVCGGVRLPCEEVDKHLQSHLANV